VPAGNSTLSTLSTLPAGSKAALQSTSQAPSQAPSLVALRAPHWPDDLVEVGRVADAYGLRGQVKVAPLSSDAAALLAARDWWLDGPLHGRLLAATRGRRRQGDMVVASIESIDERNAAEALRGARVSIRRADFPPTEAEGEYYWVDLIGCRVLNREQLPLGEVVGLLDNGAQSVLRVAVGPAGAGGERLIPFVDAYVDRVDLPGRTIWVDWQPDY
jgi:16S rRNA processing protein RimM